MFKILKYKKKKKNRKNDRSLQIVHNEIPNSNEELESMLSPSAPVKNPGKVLLKVVPIPEIENTSHTNIHLSPEVNQNEKVEENNHSVNEKLYTPITVQENESNPNPEKGSQGKKDESSTIESKDSESGISAITQSLLAKMKVLVDVDTDPGYVNPGNGYLFISSETQPNPNSNKMDPYIYVDTPTDGPQFPNEEGPSNDSSGNYLVHGPELEDIETPDWADIFGTIIGGVKEKLGLPVETENDDKSSEGNSKSGKGNEVKKEKIEKDKKTKNQKQNHTTQGYLVHGPTNLEDIELPKWTNDLIDKLPGMFGSFMNFKKKTKLKQNK